MKVERVVLQNHFKCPACNLDALVAYVLIFAGFKIKLCPFCTRELFTHIRGSLM